MLNSKLSEKILYVSFFICIGQAFLELLGILRLKIISPTNVLEITFFLLCAYNFRPDNLKLSFISFTFFVSGIILILLSRNADVPYFESIRAYKWLFFLSVLLALKKELQFRDSFLKRLYLILLFSMSISYIIQIAMNGLNSRPNLIIENNYECALLIGLFVVNISNQNLTLSKWDLKIYALLVLTILMSQSRSALISLVMVTLVTYFRSKNTKRKIYSSLILITGCVSLVIFTFNNRKTGLGNLDRFRFLEFFLNEFELKTNLNKIFGHWVIKPLNPEICIQLRFYSSLQDNELLGSCYSVIFHSYIIRAANDFGLLGAFLIFYSYGRFLFSRLKKDSALSLFIIAVANSLSVSGVNNVYVVLPMMIALLSKNLRIFEIDSKPDS